MYRHWNKSISCYFGQYIIRLFSVGICSSARIGKLYIRADGFRSDCTHKRYDGNHTILEIAHILFQRVRNQNPSLFESGNIYALFFAPLLLITSIALPILFFLFLVSIYCLLYFEKKKWICVEIANQIMLC